MNPDSLPDGGPAFPCDPFIASEPGHVSVAKRLAEGMTLRDYFATKAMAACIGRVPSGTGFGMAYPDANLNLAIASYAIADAMLRAREAK